MLGGRAAELLIFDEATTGASNDLERATEMARRMVTEFGMSAKLGPVRYAASAGLYLQSGVASRHDLSTQTAACIDEEILALVNRALQQSTEVLQKHSAVLHEVSRVLQEKEVISGEELAAIAERMQAEGVATAAAMVEGDGNGI